MCALYQLLTGNMCGSKIFYHCSKLIITHFHYILTIIRIGNIIEKEAAMQGATELSPTNQVRHTCHNFGNFEDVLTENL